MIISNLFWHKTITKYWLKNNIRSSQARLRSIISSSMLGLLLYDIWVLSITSRVPKDNVSNTSPWFGVVVAATHSGPQPWDLVNGYTAMSFIWTSITTLFSKVVCHLSLLVILGLLGGTVFFEDIVGFIFKWSFVNRQTLEGVGGGWHVVFQTS